MPKHAPSDIHIIMMRHIVVSVALIVLTASCFAADAPPASPTTRPVRVVNDATQTTITFLGVSTAVPGPGEDTACFIINGTLLVDCGWNAALDLGRNGYDPLRVETLFVTHFHHDHYLGLPGLLFYRAMRQSQQKPERPLQIIGPADDLPVVVDLSKRFLQAERFPVVWPAIALSPLKPGDAIETDRYRIQTVAAIHPVTGMCTRLTDKATGVVIAFSGDTAPNAELARLATGADLLIHEASLSPRTPDDKIAGGHSRSIDAARTAREARVAQLKLIHLPASQRDASLAAARAIFSNTSLAVEGQTLTLRAATGHASGGNPAAR